jgi:TctA family transporter
MIISHGSFDIFFSRGTSQVLLAVIAVLLLIPLLMSRLRTATLHLLGHGDRQSADDDDRDRTQV